MSNLAGMYASSRAVRFAAVHSYVAGFNWPHDQGFSNTFCQLNQDYADRSESAF